MVIKLEGNRQLAGPRHRLGSYDIILERILSIMGRCRMYCVGLYKRDLGFHRI